MVFFAYQAENYTNEVTLSYCAAIHSILDFVLRGFENPFSFIPPFQTVVCVKWQMVVLCARYKKFFVMENLCKQFIVLYWQSFLILTLLLWLLILLALFCCCHLNRNWLPKWSLAMVMVLYTLGLYFTLVNSHKTGWFFVLFSICFIEINVCSKSQSL